MVGRAKNWMHFGTNKERRVNFSATIGKKGEGCRNTENSTLPYPRTFILAPQNNKHLCWWMYIPDGIIQNTAENSKIILLILDLQEGGICASDKTFSSG